MLFVESLEHQLIVLVTFNLTKRKEFQDQRIKVCLLYCLDRIVCFESRINFSGFHFKNTRTYYNPSSESKEGLCFW